MKGPPALAVTPSLKAKKGYRKEDPVPLSLPARPKGETCHPTDMGQVAWFTPRTASSKRSKRPS
jgi:hypothetical protein